MELLLGYSVYFLIVWLAAIVVVFSLGGIFGFGIPSWGSFAWRTAVLALLVLLGTFIPIPFSGSIMACIALVMLFDMEFPDDWIPVVGFCIAMFIAQILVGILVFSVLFATAAGGAAAAG
jgi:hypothetical protein